MLSFALLATTAQSVQFQCTQSDAHLENTQVEERQHALLVPQVTTALMSHSFRLPALLVFTVQPALFHPLCARSEHLGQNHFSLLSPSVPLAHLDIIVPKVELNSQQDSAMLDILAQEDKLPHNQQVSLAQQVVIVKLVQVNLLLADLVTTIQR